MCACSTPSSTELPSCRSAARTSEGLLNAQLCVHWVFISLCANTCAHWPLFFFCHTCMSWCADLRGAAARCLAIECVLLLQNVFFYYRISSRTTCMSWCADLRGAAARSLTIECVLLLIECVLLLRADLRGAARRTIVGQQERKKECKRTHSIVKEHILQQKNTF